MCSKFFGFLKLKYVFLGSISKTVLSIFGFGLFEDLDLVLMWKPPGISFLKSADGKSQVSRHQRCLLQARSKLGWELGAAVHHHRFLGLGGGGGALEEMGGLPALPRSRTGASDLPDVVHFL